MNQVLHIFRKDARRHWLEISVSLLLLFGFAWKMPMIWTEDLSYEDRQRVLFGLLGFSVVLSWWYLIVRVIQAEPLVGDRQFWLTRPYQRRWLMAAKTLFIFAFVNVPVFIFDAGLLMHVGFSPWHHLPELLQGQLVLTAVLVLPVVTISVITESLAQFLLIFFGVIAYISGLTWLAGQNPTPSTPDDIPGAAAMIVLFSASLAMLVLQYFRRDTWVSRWILLGSLFVIATIVTAAPYDRLLERAYPEISAGSLVPAGVTIERMKDERANSNPDSGKTTSVTVPVDAGGLVRGSVVVVNAARLTIYGADGLAWNSGWVSSGRTLWPGSNELSHSFNVSNNFFSSVAGKTVDMRVDLAVSEYREGESKQITIPTGSFMVTDDAICSVGPSSYWAKSILVCKSALNKPAFTAHLDPANSTCTLPDPTWPSLQQRRNDGASDSEGGFPLVPVDPFQISFGAATNPAGDKAVSIVCPGTKIELAIPALRSRYRIGTEIRGVRLGSYRGSTSY
jgi:hypothetical protein